MNEILSALGGIILYGFCTYGAWYASTIGMRKRNQEANDYFHVSRMEYFFIRLACFLPIVNLFLICNYVDSLDYPDGKISQWLSAKKYDI